MESARPPTHSQITNFVSTLLPPQANDLPLLYFVPETVSYDIDTALVEKVVLSVTPTPKIYSATSRPVYDAEATPAENGDPRATHTLCFLMRPYTLDRDRLGSNVIVLASHTAFEDNLTIGWNPHLAERFGMDVTDCLVVEGYNQDTQKKLGIIGRVRLDFDLLWPTIEQQFGSIHSVMKGQSREIHVIVIMNAFSREEVYRVRDMIRAKGWIPEEQDDDWSCKHVLYLNGVPLEGGLDAASELGMTVVCVGHRVAEQWGIEFMGASLRSAFPGLRVEEVYEDEFSSSSNDSD